MSDFDKGDLQWLKEVADGAMDNILSVGRASRVVSHIAELEALLRAVGELPGKWRSCATNTYLKWRGYMIQAECADELEALLKGEQSGN